VGEIQTLKRRGPATRRDASGPEALLDRWVASLESGTRSRSGRRPRTAETHADSKEGAPRSKPHPNATHPADADSVLGSEALQRLRTALARVVVRGSSVHVDDATGGTIVFGRSQSRIAHQGTVAVRGPYGLTLDMFLKHTSDPAQSRAVEFVSAWFGAPFDAVTIDRSDPTGTFGWGFWPLGARDSCRALASWKETAPSSFGTLLEGYGIDVVPGQDELRGPTLVVVDPDEGIVRGGAALARLAQDQRRLALLARAGRHDDAKNAQLDVVMRGSVLPLFQMSVARGGDRRPLGEAVVSPRALAGLLLALRALDLTGMADFFTSLPSEGPIDAAKPLNDGAAWVESIAALLRSTEHGSLAHAIRRTLSSPELEM
jgi:hypothetical protein